MKTITIKTSLIISVCIAMFALLYLAVSKPADAANTPVPTFATASSTAFTLTTTPQRLLATTTTPRRYAATIQPVNCSSSVGTVFMRLENDKTAVVNTGFAVYGTTTGMLSDNPNVPVTQSSAQGVVNAGTCTVLVTEWRTLF